MLHATDLAKEFKRVRGNSIELCRPLALEDFGLQAVAETSPPKWHLAHTSWFFETFILGPFATDYRAWHPAFEHLFNSYYNGIGTPFSRATASGVAAHRSEIQFQHQSVETGLPSYAGKKYEPCGYRPGLV